MSFSVLLWYMQSSHQYKEVFQSGFNIKTSFWKKLSLIKNLKRIERTVFKTVRSKIIFEHFNYIYVFPTDISIQNERQLDIRKYPTIFEKFHDFEFIHKNYSNFANKNHENYFVMLVSLMWIRTVTMGKRKKLSGKSNILVKFLKFMLYFQMSNSWLHQPIS